MSDFQDFHERALSETLAFIGESITYGTRTIAAVVNNVTLEETLEDGGLFKQSGAIAICSIASFPTPPKIGATVLYNGGRLRILKVEKDLCSYELTLASDAK